MLTIIVAALAIGIFSSTKEGRRAARDSLARWNWLMGGFIVIVWAAILLT